MGSARILVVEDEEMVRELMTEAIGALGHEVVEAEDGEQALEQIEFQTFDAVVTDIRMPRMDGMELLKAIVRRDPDVPVIIQSGHPSVETAIEAVEYNAFRYLTKPFELEKLTSAVQHAVRLRQLARLKSQALAISGCPGGRTGSFEALEASFERLMARFWVAYQPIVDAAAGTVFGYEALLRTDEPSLPHPGAALQAAERLQKTDTLGRAIRDRAVEPLADHSAQDILFLNLHPSDLLDDSLLSNDTPLAGLAWRTVLEITERASLESIPDVQGRVESLRQLGFRIAVDDLGAGYAGLTSFVSLDPDFVKIDMTLVRGVNRDPVRQRLIRSLTSLCEEMGILVVAEGIETEAERETVVDLGCDLLQGYLLARPGRPFPDVTWPS